MGKGSDRERDLVNMFYDMDWGVMRAPGSGGGTEREQPDILAGKSSKDMYIAIEAKSTKQDYKYVEKEEVNQLYMFCEKFGVDKCRIGFRFNYKDWRFFEPSNLSRTSSGKYSMKKENVSDGESFKNLIEKED